MSIDQIIVFAEASDEFLNSFTLIRNSLISLIKSKSEIQFFESEQEEIDYKNKINFYEDTVFDSGSGLFHVNLINQLMELSKINLLFKLYQAWWDKMDFEIHSKLKLSTQKMVNHLIKEFIDDSLKESGNELWMKDI